MKADGKKKVKIKKAAYQQSQVQVGLCEL